MSKRLGLVFVVSFFCLVMAQNAFAAALTKEFTFELSPGETSKNWEINVPLPENETGKFIGRDFKPVVDTTQAELMVEKETLSDKNYYAKGRLVGLASGTPQPAVSGKLQIDLSMGEAKPKDTPSIPVSLGIKSPYPFEMKWSGVGDEGKTLPISAKYLYYQIKDGATGALVTEQLVPVYLVGFRFPIKYELKENVKYKVTVQLSNVSGQYSKPISVGFEYPFKLER